MGNTSRLISLVLGLAVGILLGHIFWPSKPKEGPRVGFAGANVVYVGPKASDVNPSDLILHLKDDPVVYWKPWVLNEGHGVSITFAAKDYPPGAQGEPPFIGGKKNEDQPIRCAGETCFSYQVNGNVVKLFQSGAPNLTCPDFPDLKPCLEYPYTQALGDKNADGRIIIVKP